MISFTELYTYTMKDEGKKVKTFLASIPWVHILFTVHLIKYCEIEQEHISAHKQWNEVK